MQKIIFILALTTTILNLLKAQTSTAPALGDGSSGNPYQIANLENLYWIAENTTRWSKDYIQTANIDASETSTWFSGSGWIPIGNGSNYFSGSYDGQGFVISNLFIDRDATDYIGLFGYITEGSVSNLGITNVDITGHDYVGSVAGQNFSNSVISNCYSSGNVEGSGGRVGGLVGRNYSATIEKSYSLCNVFAVGNSVGGFVGWNYVTAIIRNCYCRGDVTRRSGSNAYYGGFVGSNTNSNSNIEYCYCTGSIYYEGADDPTNNGFLAYNFDAITTSNFWDSENSNQSTSTGATAKNTSEMKTASTFTNAGWDIAIWNIGDGINDLYPYLDWQNPDGTPLPVELTNFDGFFNGSEVVLKWETATEVNNYGFDVERRSSSLTEWEQVRFVQGHGTTNSPKQYSFTDPLNLDLNPNLTRIDYRLKQIDNDGTFAYSKIVTVDLTKITSVADEIVYEFTLEQNYPNPFNPTTTIKFTVPNVGDEYIRPLQTKLIVYNILGREVAILVNKKLQSGNHEVSFDASNLSSGMYFYRINVGSEYQLVKKMMLVK